MAKPKVTELKAMYTPKSLIELTGIVEQIKESTAKDKEMLKDYFAQLNTLDMDSKRYISKIKDVMCSIKYHTDSIEWNEVALPVADEILKSKQSEQRDMREYEAFLKANAETLKPFTDAVETLRAEALDKWTTEGDYTEAEVNEIHNFLRDQTVCMLMDKTDTIEECRITYNHKIGFDGWYKIPEGSIRVSTIPVGGYNIVRFHWRTNIEIIKN